MLDDSVSAFDAARFAALVERRAAAACPAGPILVRRTLDRLPPDRWVLEWRLPGWLGAAFGLDSAIAEELTVANILGLLAIRLEDDARDGELDPADRALSAAVGPALLAEGLAVYAGLLPAGDPFWRWLDALMTRFRAASSPDRGGSVADTAASRPGVARSGAAFGRDRLRLADRGAPLKVAPRAICALTDRLEVWPQLEVCLDAALEMLVRYDQVMDWEEDLAAGRWNAFVASITANPQDANHCAANRTAVLVALLADGATMREFERIAAAGERAAMTARSLGAVTLAEWLGDHLDRTRRQGGEIEAHYSGLATQASQLIFGAVTPAA